MPKPLVENPGAVSKQNPHPAPGVIIFNRLATGDGRSLGAAKFLKIVEVQEKDDVRVNLIEKFHAGIYFRQSGSFALARVVVEIHINVEIRLGIHA